MFRAFLLLLSPAWDAVKLILKVGFICPFVVIDLPIQVQQKQLPSRMLDHLRLISPYMLVKFKWGQWQILSTCDFSHLTCKEQQTHFCHCQVCWKLAIAKNCKVVLANKSSVIHVLYVLTSQLKNIQQKQDARSWIAFRSHRMSMVHPGDLPAFLKIKF